MQKRLFRVLCAASLVMSMCIAGIGYSENRTCERLVSLAPSVTEVLFDLSLGSSVVGVTRFCRYPEAALQIQSIGGMYDLNLEQIVAQRPTHIFALTEHAQAVEPLRRMGIRVVLLDHRGTSQILESYRIVGRECGFFSQAAARVAHLEQEGTAIRSRCAKARAPHPPLQVMVVVGRGNSGSSNSDVYVSGADGFYTDVLDLLGAENVYRGKTVAIPTVSNEGVLKLNPDIILEIVNVDDGDLPSAWRSFWEKFTSIPAVIHNRVFILKEDYASIPGPRYILLARKLSDLLCSE